MNTESTQIQELQNQMSILSRQMALLAGGMAKAGTPQGDSITLDEYYPIWEATKSHDVQKTTLDKNRHMYKRISKVFGGKRLSDIQRADVQDFVNQMAEEGLSMDNIKHTKGMLGSMLALALADDYIVKNPCTAVKLPRVKTEKKRPATKEEYQALVKVTKSHRLGFTIPLLFETGLRVGEMLALTWDDVDFQNKCLHVSKQYVASCGLGEAVLKNHTKTQAGMRDIPLSNSMLKRLKAVKKESGKRRFVVGKVKEDAMTNPSVYRKIFNRWKWEANVGNDLTPHSARHYFATNMLKSGVSIALLRQILGHADGSTTLDIYCHDSNEFNAKDRRKIEKGLRGLGLRNS